MRKASVFLILMLISLFLLVLLFIVAFLSTPTIPSESSWDNMWSCMGDWMSGRYATTNLYGSVFGISLIVLVGFVIVGIGGVVYFQFFPEIKSTSRSIQQSSQTHQDSPPIGSVLKTLKEDERKVVDVLINHNGEYLQKYVRKEAGLSRLKTHRVLARLAERGIVTLEKTGNTNEVRIADWLKKEENRR